MNKDVAAQEPLSLAKCVKAIESKKLYHNEIPDEMQNDMSIIRTEIAAGTRWFGNRGYDVIRNRFFVVQTIQLRNYREEIIDRIEDIYFDTFEEYYAYTNGDVYNQACYYQYAFSKETIEKYDIDLTKISSRAFVEDTLSIRSEAMDRMDEEAARKIESQKASLLEWREKFCACRSYKELSKVALAFYKEGNDKAWGFVLSSFALCNKERNIPLLIKLLLETNYTNADQLMTMLCVQYGDDSILDCFDSTYWKRKSEIKSLICGLSDGSVVEERAKYYDKSLGFFCISCSLADTKSAFFSRTKGCVTYYYETFDEFVEGCQEHFPDLNMIDGKIDFSDDYLLQLMLGHTENACYSVRKYYDLKMDAFIVEEQWREDFNSPIIKERTYLFEQLVDFVSFLEGDLSNADLLLCDGLAFLTDFTQINLEGAWIVSSVKERAGLLRKDQVLALPMPPSIEVVASSELPVIEDEAIPHEEPDNLGETEHKKIYYVSDLHLPHRIHLSNVKTEEDVVATIRKIVVELTRNVRSWDILLIVGDTSCDITYFKVFVEMLRQTTLAQIVFVLGNHELWEFQHSSFSDIVCTYRDILENKRMFLLQNNVIYSDAIDNNLQQITEVELATMDEAVLREKVAGAPIILFGGLAFSGLNQNFNAQQGVYQGTITRTVEIEESQKFERLYTKIRDSLPDREVIIATHMPLTDWSHDVNCHSGYVYVSGHTHRNEFYDDGIQRFYADNQIGYYRKHVCAKNFCIEGTCDLFMDYGDGLYEISRNQYVDFCRGKNIQMDFNRYFEHLYMLKRGGYYCFIMQTEKGKLSILNGGKTKIIKNKTIESCYEDMPEVIATLKEKFALDEFSSLQRQISDLVKGMGGNGRIHGAIVDIDFFNHIYVNPNDLKITPYHALTMSEKIIYGNIQNLLTERRPDLLVAYEKYLSEAPSTALALRKNIGDGALSSVYYSTDIYKYSNIVKKVQRLNSNILAVWPEKSKSKSGIIDGASEQKQLKV